MGLWFVSLLRHREIVCTSGAFPLVRALCRPWGFVSVKLVWCSGRCTGWCRRSLRATQSDSTVITALARPDNRDSEWPAFKDSLDRFVRTYAFTAQIVSFSETKLERDYLYCRALGALLRDASTVERLDLGSEVELTHLRTEATFEGSLALQPEVGDAPSSATAPAPSNLPDMEALSQIVEVLNERYGLNLDRRRPAAVRPVRGDLGCRRRPRRPGPQ